MFASKGSGSESNSSFEIIDDEEVAAIEGPGYSFIVDFKIAVEEKIKNIGEGSENILQLWHDVDENKKVKREGRDEENRPLFVRLQAIMERTQASFLANGKISAVGAIHTPTPATPLRADPNPEKIEKGVVTEEIEKDPKRLQTVTDRAVIVREYLDKKGELFSAYQTDTSDDGSKIAGMDIFNQCLTQYQNLHGVQLKTFQPKFTGATYILGNEEKNSFVFSSKSYQANQELAEIKKWCIWFGPVDLNKVQDKSFDKIDRIEKRLAKVNSFLHTNGGIDIIKEYKRKVSTILEQAQVAQPFGEHGLNAA